MRRLGIRMTTEEIPKPWLKTLEGVRKTSLEYKELIPFKFLEHRATNEPNDPMVIFPNGKTLTYSEVLNAVKRFQGGLRKLGIKKGDRIALMLPNTPHYIIAHFAVASLGAIVVQTNPLYTHRELKHQMSDSGAKAIITLTLFQDKVNEVAMETDLEIVICGNISEFLNPLKAFFGKLLNIFEDPKMKPLPNNYTFKEVMQMNPDGFMEEDIGLDDIAVLQYTGGTTGLSKGAALTHRNISYNSQQTREVVNTVPEKRGSILVALPLFHSFGFTVGLGLSLQLGVPMVLVAKFKADEVLNLIEKHRITFFPAVPTMIVAMLNHPKTKSTDMSSLIAVISGGAPLPLQVAKEFKEVTGGDLVEGYGLSEASPVTHANPVGSTKIKPKVGSIGLPVPDTIVKIVDSEDGKTLVEIGEIGELCIKGPQVMKEYWNKPEETKKTIIDGWLHTGDIAKMDQEGYAYIVDRKKDLIIVSGYNVIPREVEEVLYEHPKILEAAVAGITDPVKGEIVAAWVVLKEGETMTEEEVIAYCKENLAPYKVPKKVTFRDELPKSMIGKILRKKLVEGE